MGFLDKLMFWRRKPEPPPSVPEVLGPQLPPPPPEYWVKADDLISALQSRTGLLYTAANESDSQTLQAKLRARAQELEEWIRYCTEKKEV